MNYELREDSQRVVKSLKRVDSSILGQLADAVKSKQAELASSRQLRPIVPIEEWLESEYYLGPDHVRLYDFWKEQIAEIFRESNRYNEVIITGSIGIGKSTAALVILLRRLYEISCFTNIPPLFDLMATSDIYFIYFSLTKMQAQATGFGQLRSMIDSIPYFQRDFPRNVKKSSRIDFVQAPLKITYGSGTSHAISMNLMGSILDEANFFSSESQDPNIVQNYSKITKLYSSIITRGQSRFLNKGIDHSISILISSATVTSSFIERRIFAAAGSSHTKVVDARLWEVKPKGTYSSEYFYVFQGSELVDPRVVEDVMDVLELSDALGFKHPYGLSNSTEIVEIDKVVDMLPFEYRCKFHRVPVDFRRSFSDANIFSALQDILGVSVSSTNKLFTSRKAFKAVLSDKLYHPFVRDVLTVSTDDALSFGDFILDKWVPRYTDKPRFIHIDQSTTGCSTGVAMCHLETWEEAADLFDTDLVAFDKANLIVVMDLHVRIDPPKKPAELDIKKVRDLIFYLRENYKISYGMISYDWFACVSGDTGVLMADGTVKCIQDIVVGDEVVTGEVLGKQEFEVRRVVDKYVYENAGLYGVSFFRNSEVLKATAGHRVFVRKDDGLGYVEIPVIELEYGDVVFHYSAQDKKFMLDVVVGIEKIERAATVYDLEVEEQHRYFANGVCVHNSQESLQVLRKSNLSHSHLSVDRTDEAYLTLVNLIGEGRLKTYDYEPFRSELFNLLHFRAQRKVDHPANGTKDVTDAVCGAVFNAVTVGGQLAGSVVRDYDILFSGDGYEDESEDLFNFTVRRENGNGGDWF